MTSIKNTGTSDSDCSSVSTSEVKAQNWLEQAEFKEILGSDASHKSLFILLRQRSGEEGILLLNKSPFAEDKDIIQKFTSSAKLKEITKNDIFGNYQIMVDPSLNLINAQLIFPSNEKLVAKYRFEDKYVLRESPEDYFNITLKYIEKYQMKLDWVYNFLNKTAESERIIYEDADPHNGFLMAPDIKWDGKNVENLYTLAIINRKGVKSVRDLNANDLPMLENIREKCLQIIKEKYGLRGDQIRAYFHYQPSFFHLHVHFVNLKYEAPATIILSAISLDDVINNIKMVPDFYQKATLSFTRKKSDKLLEMFKDAGRIEL